MARTGITNLTGHFIMLPQPYAGGLPPGRQAVVADSTAIVTAALGGATNLVNRLRIDALATGASLTTHGNALGQRTFLETLGSNGAGGVTFTGAAVGDAVVNVSDTVNGVDLTSSFESTVSVINSVRQTSASDLSATDILIIILNKS